MPDAEMDSAVQRHLGVAPPGNMSPEADSIISSLMQAVGQHVAAQQQARAGASSNTNDLAAATLMQKGQHHVENQQAMQGLAQIIGQSVAELAHVLGPALQELIANTSHTKEVVLSINNLSATILEIGKALITLSRTPKEIYHGDDGKPKGVRPVALGMDGKPLT